MKKFKVFSVMALVALMLATSIGSVSAEWTEQYGGAVIQTVAGHDKTYPETIKITHHDDGSITWTAEGEIWINDYYINFDPTFKYVVYYKDYQWQYLWINPKL